MILTSIYKSIKKISEFEYWPFGVFYIPLYFYGFYLAFKARSFMYFSAANPGMKYGGVMGESKIKILNKIEKSYLPKTLFFKSSTTYRQIIFTIKTKGLAFPVIIKPNIGERGKGVEKIEDEAALVKYFKEYPVQDLIVQEYVDAPLEIGVLYYRFPDKKTGNISSVVLKEFLTVNGNGKDTLQRLIAKHPRAKARNAYLKEKYAASLHIILAKGEKAYLEPIGNHCRGTKFLNGNHIVNPQLVKVFDKIAANIEGYNYGRFDLKVSSLEALYRGEDIKILELNGVSSEPAHIYDPSMKLWQAYKDLLAHAAIIQQIGVANHKSGIPYDSLKTFLSDLLKFLFPIKKRNQDITKLPRSGVAQ